MNDSQYMELLTAYLDGSITAEQRARLNDLIDAGEIDILEIKEMELMYRNLGSLPAPEPSKDLTSRFYRMVEEEKESHEQIRKEAGATFMNIRPDWLAQLQAFLSPRRIGYSLALLLAGVLIGNWTTPFQNYRQQLSDLSTEVSQMREVMMISLLDNRSATERLKAVNISSDMRSADERVTEALLKTLNNDPNVNVRLAAVEALLKHSGNARVREGLVNAISSQQSPLVQAALADAMLLLQDKESVNEFRQLLNRDDLDPGVRDKLRHTIAVLS